MERYLTLWWRYLQEILNSLGQQVGCSTQKRATSDTVPAISCPPRPRSGFQNVFIRCDTSVSRSSEVLLTTRSQHAPYKACVHAHLPYFRLLNTRSRIVNSVGHIEVVWGSDLCPVLRKRDTHQRRQPPTSQSQFLRPRSVMATKGEQRRAYRLSKVLRHGT